jgi:hypothetical protein
MNKKWIWTGRVLSTLSGLFMLFDGIIHIAQPPIVIQSFQQQGYPLQIIFPLALVELVCVLLYIIPRSALLGAILLTGYLGGAVDYNVRAGNPFSEILFPVSIAIALWAGLYLRSQKLRVALKG